MRSIPCIIGLLLLATAAVDASAQPGRASTPDLGGFKLRGIGPALMAGRIVDVAVDPSKTSVKYLAAASGGVWKTENNGTTWKPVFDRQGSYSIGCITLDPNNPNVVWVGSGENNSQRSVGFGDGVYKSLDGGKSWRNTGLKDSQHIGKILVDPRDSDVVYAAAQGPLWSSGGDRGLYKTIDGGKTWSLSLEIDPDTGVSDIALDPRNPDILYAASYQRRRHVWTLVAAGPGSAIYKSADAGATWLKLETGLPSGDLGRIGIAVSPIRPDVVYATIAAAGNDSGFYRSSDRGESWTKQSDYVSVDPQYYQELFPDPHRYERIYNMDVFLHVSDDGGRTWRRMTLPSVHVDHHALQFDPDDPDYLLLGNDGGAYESWDQGKTWKFIANLPITQFYRVGLDDDRPFYNIYGGTQDNSTLGGPSRTRHRHGIRNSDWFITVGGDGYQTRVDPTDPNTLYSMFQYGGLIRYDRVSGQRIDIQPQPDGDESYRWNWDSPLIISPHSPTRLYFAANRLFRSDDRGDNWRSVSPDLTRRIDRNRLQAMGRTWSVDSPWKNAFTSFYGNITALDESTLQEGLIYIGTDDGMLQVSENGGADWRKVDSFPGVPQRTYVSDVLASRHDANVVYAAFNNHKNGDFSPYVLRSADRGRSWTSLAQSLPERQVVWTIEEDHEDAQLLFAGTEFGLFCSFDGGGRWLQLKGGMPTIQVRDIALQRRQDDLVAATFGRGFYILDDYSPLRHVSESLLQEEGHLFAVKDAHMYIEAQPLGSGRRGTQGDALYSAPNPPFGAVFTYYLRDGLKSLSRIRREEEKELRRKEQPVHYPSWDDLRREDRETAPAIVLTVRDQEGQVVRRMAGPSGAGFHRVSWDLRYPSPRPIRSPRDGSGSGLLAMPGNYSVQLAKRVDGLLTPLGSPQSFAAAPLDQSPLSDAQQALRAEFQRKAARLQRAALGAREVVENTLRELDRIRAAADASTSGDAAATRARQLRNRLLDIRVELVGDQTVSRRNEPVPPSILDRIQRLARAYWGSTSAITGTHRRDYERAAAAFEPLLQRLRQLVEGQMPQLQQDLESVGAPWTPGRGVPRWKP